jgi:adenylylsulfate kinase
METHLRSVVKGISWRAVGTLDTTILVFLFSGKMLLAATVGLTELVTKVFLYWAHERVWQRIKWGRVFPPTTSP